MRSLAVPMIISLLAACGGAEPAAPAAKTCDLGIDTLNGKTFVEAKILPGGEVKPDAQARVKFSKEGDKISAKYTVKNALHVYDYDCAPTARDGELLCKTEADPRRVCMALEVQKQGSCSLERAKEFGFELDAEKSKKAFEEAKKLVGEARKSPQWKQFALMNNNVANTLQGLLYVSVNEKKCNLKIDDMFGTIHENKRKEDFNPVGANDFVSDSAEYLFEDCLSDRLLADMAEPSVPDDLSKIPKDRRHKVGADVHYFYVGKDALAPEKDCAYSIDTWANWKPVVKGQAVEAKDGKLDWHTAHKWSAADRRFVGAVRNEKLEGGFFHMTRYKECAGKKEKIDTICNSTVVVE